MPRGSLALGRVENEYRGTKFVLEELDAATYDKLLKLSTTTVENKITGEDEERIDESQLQRLMLDSALIQPKGIKLTQLGTRLLRQLERDCRDLHFGFEPDTSTKPKASGEEDDESPNEVES